MTKQEIKKRILAYKWERWLEREFGAFILSLFRDGIKREWMEKLGVKGEMKAWLSQESVWYKSEEVFGEFNKQLEDYLQKGGTIFRITDSCEKYYHAKKERIKKMTGEDKDCLDKLKEFYEIISLVISFIWLAHGLDDVYTKKLREEVSKYISKEEEREKFIGDISFPSKKTAHTKMEEAMLAGEDSASIAAKYGWLKIRDGFSEPFTPKEIAEEKKKIFSSADAGKEASKIKIPAQFLALAKEAQELVYYRTFRTDIFYEFLFLARPIFREVADKYSIDFQDLANYSIHDLLAGSPKKYPQKITVACYRGELAFFKEPILREEELREQEVKGVIAFRGKIRGRVKVVKSTGELAKVKKGDILVTQMTFPAFIMAMKRAAAFVTDEGGITCHAAIVAREMKKPCIIGTRIATKVLKDGDLVEVDANKGVVRKI